MPSSIAGTPQLRPQTDNDVDMRQGLWEVIEGIEVAHLEDAPPEYSPPSAPLSAPAPKRVGATAADPQATLFNAMAHTQPSLPRSSAHHARQRALKSAAQETLTDALSSQPVAPPLRPDKIEPRKQFRLLPRFQRELWYATGDHRTEICDMLRALPDPTPRQVLLMKNLVAAPTFSARNQARLSLLKGERGNFALSCAMLKLLPR